MNTFVTRALTSLVYGAVVFGSIVAGNMFFILPLFCCVLCMLGCREYYRITSPHMNKILQVIGTVMGMSLPLIAAAAQIHHKQIPVIGTGGLAGLIALFYAIVVGTFVIMVWSAFTPTSSVKDSALALFGALYLGIPLASLVLIREMEHGIVLSLMIVVSVWAADIFAYLGGSLFGRYRIAPTISPKKTWEGFAAGTLGAIAVWAILPLVFEVGPTVLGSIVIGVLVSVAALVGDLYESRIKREAGVKDSGTMLPGHGGILDRIDSMLAVSLVLFILLSVLGTFLGVIQL
ncbi:MAG: phosphatidate cytidylyltransferase [Coriobacteriia bacterium]|nr:phosphatidate cytidylyltransferase [Coriobacteriia bacterium]